MFEVGSDSGLKFIKLFSVVEKAPFLCPFVLESCSKRSNTTFDPSDFLYFVLAPSDVGLSINFRDETYFGIESRLFCSFYSFKDRQCMVSF